MISNLNPLDVRHMVPLWKSYALEHAPYDSAFSIRDEDDDRLTEFLTNVWLAPGHHVFVYGEAASPSGFIHFATADLPYPHNSLRHGLIEALYISSHQRRKGIGSMLFHHVDGWLRERSITRIHLNVASANTEALHFWRKRGFDELTVTLKRKEK